jgi:hypothetical protein
MNTSEYYSRDPSFYKRMPGDKFMPGYKRMPGLAWHEGRAAKRYSQGTPPVVE